MGLVDLLPRLVALKAVDPTFLTTILITGPVATCVPLFGKLGLQAFCCLFPASVDYLPSAPLFGFSPVLPHSSFLLFPYTTDPAGRPVSHTGSLGIFALVVVPSGTAHLTPGQPYWFSRCLGALSSPTLHPLPFDLLHLPPSNSSPFPVPHSCP